MCKEDSTGSGTASLDWIMIEAGAGNSSGFVIKPGSE